MPKPAQKELARHKTIQDRKPVVRVPWMVVWGNLYVLAERLELLAAGFVRLENKTIQGCDKKRKNQVGNYIWCLNFIHCLCSSGDV